MQAGAERERAAVDLQARLDDVQRVRDDGANQPGSEPGGRFIHSIHSWTCDGHGSM